MPKRIPRPRTPSPAQPQSDQAALEHKYRRFISQAASDRALCDLVDSIDRAVLAQALDDPGMVRLCDALSRQYDSLHPQFAVGDLDDAVHTLFPEE